MDENKFKNFKYLLIIGILLIISITILIFNSKQLLFSNFSNKADKAEEFNKVLNNQISNSISLSNNYIIEENIFINENNIENISESQLNEIIKTKLEKYYQLRLFDKNAPPMGGAIWILAELELEEIENLYKLSQSSNNQDYIKTNVKYDTFKNKMLTYITPELFEEYYSIYNNIDGYVAGNNSSGSERLLDSC